MSVASVSDAAAEIGVEFSVGERVRFKSVDVGGMITTRMAGMDVPFRFGVLWDGGEFSWHTPDEIEVEPRPVPL